MEVTDGRKQTREGKGRTGEGEGVAHVNGEEERQGGREIDRQVAEGCMRMMGNRGGGRNNETEGSETLCGG